MADDVHLLPADLARLPALFDLSGKVALVTGAASGLGRAIAIGLAVHGADVVVADLNLAGAQATAGVIAGLGRKTLAIGVDVTSWEQVVSMVEQTVAAFARIDISFNVPGINVRKPALEMTSEEFRSVIDVNLTGVFHCARAVGEVMVRQGGGRMVNIASMFGHAGSRRSAAYTASKHAVVGLTRVLALEWAEHGVRVNSLGPGYTRSALTEPWMSDPVTARDREQATPMGRFADPWEMVGPAIFMVSDASTFMTGAGLIVDGGYTTG
ncbi:MAG: SDR family oxidoreductase [Chloroflexi bacterium]|nr:SDR family oxidoreductase [Chloroflexota bacterium]